jgi:hypothetical protein
MPDICFITTCRGRLAHLKRALPTFASQPGTACVVVDYDCPEGTADWVEANHPEVQVVKARERPRYEAARARNMGAQAPAALQAQWLCFVDADALLAPEFAETVRPLLSPGCFLRPAPRTLEAGGTFLCHQDDFRAAEGYDDVLQGYGMEDDDLLIRLGLNQVQSRTFPGAMVKMISHDSRLRVEHIDVKDLQVSITANQVYCNAKWDLMQLRGAKLPAQARSDLYAYISKAVLDSQRHDGVLKLRVSVRQQSTRSHGVMETSLLYQLNKGSAGPQGGAGT